MLLFSTGILLLFLAGALYSLKNTEDWMKSIDKKEHKLYLLYPLANWLLVKSGLEKVLAKKREVAESIKALYLTSKPEVLYKLFWCRRVSIILAILVLFNLLSVIGLLTSADKSIIRDEKYIERPGYGEGRSKVELGVVVEKKDTGSDIKNTPREFDLTINVNEQNYTQEELYKIFDRSFEYLKKEVLGMNKSAETVNEKLNFINTIPGTSIKVDWIPEDYSLIKSDGTIMNDNISPKGLKTTVTAILSYKEQDKKLSMAFTILPKKLSEEEILKEKLEEEIAAASEQTRTDRLLELPVSLEDYRLVWNENKENSGLTLLFLGILLAAAVWIFGDKELEKQMKLRKEQMLIDYPEIINKFTLLINAGMTIKQAWVKMSEDYSSMNSRKGAKKQYAYEEMLTTVHELNLGVPENTAYEQYGRRAGLIPYIKFSSLITQNLKKGTNGFTELLLHEAAEAFEERKEIAKRLGEEAGTKLLIPMMVMLIIVFLIIMIPAFLSFRI